MGLSLEHANAPWGFLVTFQVRLLERYSELACPEAAAAYQDCYSKSLARGDIVLDNCSQQVGSSSAVDDVTAAGIFSLTIQLHCCSCAADSSLKDSKEQVAYVPTAARFLTMRESHDA